MSFLFMFAFWESVWKSIPIKYFVPHYDRKCIITYIILYQISDKMNLTKQDIIFIYEFHKYHSTQ